MAQLVYILCTLAALLCAVLLMRGYKRSKHDLLFWSAMCFMILALANIILVVDLVVLGPDGADLVLWRSGLSLVGMCVLLYGLIFKSSSSSP
ncbi:MAG: DUF5985 family protein [Roseimicrobium sp.]